MTFAEHFLTSPKFNRYPQWVKEEMAAAIYEKIERNLKNLKDERKDGFFNYWTACGSSACADYLANYYKHINLRRHLLLEELERQYTLSPTM